VSLLLLVTLHLLVSLLLLVPLLLLVSLLLLVPLLLLVSLLLLVPLLLLVSLLLFVQAVTRALHVLHLPLPRKLSCVVSVPGFICPPAIAGVLYVETDPAVESEFS
jgi:hypothetical protein